MQPKAEGCKRAATLKAAPGMAIGDLAYLADLYRYIWGVQRGTD